MTIGIKREQKRSSERGGPGEYNPETANILVKPNVPITDFNRFVARQDIKADPSNGPGSNTQSKEFGYNLNQMTIGERRQIPEDPKIGPGKYQPSEKITKPNARAINFINQVGRKSKLLSPTAGPGYYLGTRYNFGDSSKGQTIGVKRQTQQNDSIPGPGFYNPKPELVKPKAVVIDFKSITSRIQKDADVSQGPGTYNI